MNTIQEQPNMQKYDNYRFQKARLKRALSTEFYLEAIFIEYAILEDRLESALKHGRNWQLKEGEHISIDRKVKLVGKMAEQKKSLAEKYFKPELLKSILDWKESRNRLIHSLMKQNLDSSDLKSVAIQGKDIVDALDGKVRLFNAALEREKSR